MCVCVTRVINIWNTCARVCVSGVCNFGYTYGGSIEPASQDPSRIELYKCIKRENIVMKVVST